ncbi:Cox19-like CHCH family [Micractinium conductrix]|uniref:Cox19-like CHCH family n=1 Tax=Micractinium conductrix TaxID=554055 RepID=A0A2P6V567_9CHLO|nr:Cox19-like CHCH family [Micractinium conductrix]|eukprot:PSC69207.1 Cox19-like CHCH family [Micractinium conductrix]
MARSRSRSAPRPASRPAPAPASRTQSHGTHTQARPFTPPPSSPPPMPHQSAPPPAMPQQGGGMMAGLGGMVAQGMALGTGSALAHRAVDSVLGSRHPEPAAATQAAQEIVNEQQPCAGQAKAFADCMGWSNGDMGACQDYFDAMQQCRLNLKQ